MSKVLETRLKNENNLNQDLLKFNILSKVHLYKQNTKNYLRSNASKLMPTLCKNALKRLLR